MGSPVSVSHLEEGALDCKHESHAQFYMVPGVQIQVLMLVGKCFIHRAQHMAAKKA